MKHNSEMLSWRSLKGILPRTALLLPPLILGHSLDSAAVERLSKPVSLVANDPRIGEGFLTGFWHGLANPLRFFEVAGLTYPEIWGPLYTLGVLLSSLFVSYSAITYLFLCFVDLLKVRARIARQLRRSIKWPLAILGGVVGALVTVAVVSMVPVVYMFVNMLVGLGEAGFGRDLAPRKKSHRDFWEGIIYLILILTFYLNKVVMDSTVSWICIGLGAAFGFTWVFFDTVDARQRI